MQSWELTTAHGRASVCRGSVHRTRLLPLVPAHVGRLAEHIFSKRFIQFRAFGSRLQSQRGNAQRVHAEKIAMRPVPFRWTRAAESRLSEIVRSADPFAAWLTS